MSNCIIESPNEHATAKANGLTFPEPVRAHYDSHRRCYWIENARRGWIQVDETSLRRMLRSSGVSSKCQEGEFVSPLEKELVRTQTDADVDYAGPLAGYRMGCHEICDKRVLVTSQANLITPQPGEYRQIGAIIDNLFADPEHDQRPYVFGWLKVAIESLYSNQRRPGQVLAIAGERGCGKSLLQKLITEIFGGRAAKPYRYMSGGTDFNSELFGAEHLMIEDEVATTDGRKRRDFGAKIKDFTVNEIHSCHPKQRPATSLTPFWRITITLNDEPENLAILPPIDESLVDKLILLKADKKPMPSETETLEGRNKFWAALVAELPAFIHMLLSYVIPEPLRCDRFGVKYYHHPEIIAALNELSDESKLLSLIDTTLFQVSTTWTGTADELRQALCASSVSGHEARQLLSWNNATGTYLGRLSRRHPERIQSERDWKQGRSWIVKKG